MMLRLAGLALLPAIAAGAYGPTPPPAYSPTPPPYDPYAPPPYDPYAPPVSAPCGAGQGADGTVYRKGVHSSSSRTFLLRLESDGSWARMSPGDALLSAGYIQSAGSFTSAVTGYPDPAQWTVAYDGTVVVVWPDGHKNSFQCGCQCAAPPPTPPTPPGPTPPPTPPTPPPPPPSSCEWEGQTFLSGTSRMNDNEERCTCTDGTWGTCCRQRKEFVTAMTDAERQRYLDAVKSVSRPSSPYRTQFAELVDLHYAVFSGDIHSNPAFLPWHRWFILQMENLLRNIHPAITVPFWDWSLEATNPTASVAWSSAAWWLGGDGQAGGCVEDGPFAYDNGNGYTQTDGSCLQRAFRGTSVATVLDVQQAHNDHPLPDNYDAFRNRVEHGFGFHDSVHCTVHGTMCSARAANDPAFFLHHAHVDKIWDDWQKQSAAHTAAYDGSTLNPMLSTNGATPADFLDLTSQTSSNVCVMYVDSDDAAVLATLVSRIPPSGLKTITRSEVPYTDEQWFDEQQYTAKEKAEVKGYQDASRQGVPTVPQSELENNHSASTFDKMVGAQVEDVLQVYAATYEATLQYQADQAKEDIISAYVASDSNSPGDVSSYATPNLVVDLKMGMQYARVQSFSPGTFVTKLSEDYDRTESNPDFQSKYSLAVDETTLMAQAYPDLDAITLDNEKSPERYGLTRNVNCQGSSGNAFIVADENCNGLPGRCTRKSSRTNVEGCKQICDEFEECSGFAVNDSGCYFRKGELDYSSGEDSDNDCYVKPRPCEFEVSNYPAYNGNYVRTGEGYNGWPLFANIDNNRQVWQYNNRDGWDLCTRDADTGPSSCAVNIGRAGHVSTLGENRNRKRKRKIYTWGGAAAKLDTCSAYTLAPFVEASCDVEVSNYPAYNGNYKRTGESYNGWPLLANVDNIRQVWQYNNNDGWDLCVRTADTGPSNCSGSSGRGGFATALGTSDIFTWGGAQGKLDTCAGYAVEPTAPVY